MLGWDTMSHNDWSRLFHAYGPATDTPQELAGLATGDIDPDWVIEHLHGAVLHQGTIYSATPPAVRLLAGMLQLPVMDAGEGPVLAEVLEWFAAVGDSAAYIEVDTDQPEPTPQEWDSFYGYLASEDDQGLAWQSPAFGAAMRAAVLEVRGMAPDILPVLAAHLDDHREPVREQAMRAVAKWGALAPEHDAVKAAVRTAWARLEQAPTRDERAAIVLSLGELGADLSDLMQDSDVAVRACAALFVRSTESTDLLVDALTRPDEVNEWFDVQPTYFDGWARFRLLEEVIDRGVSIERLLPAALALIRRERTVTSREWGPILRLAFPHPEDRPRSARRLPEHLTPAQHAVLAAVAGNNALWRPTDGNAHIARAKAGVPNDRDELLALLARR